MGRYSNSKIKKSNVVRGLDNPNPYNDVVSYRTTIYSSIPESDKDIWVNALFGTDCEKVVTDMTSNGVACWVVDDLRFPNEAERILSCNGILIRINRSDAEESEHIVENSLNDWVDWDLTIENNYPTEKEFIKELELILREYLEGKIAKRGATDEGQSIKHS